MHMQLRLTCRSLQPCMEAAQVKRHERTSSSGSAPANNGIGSHLIYLGNHKARFCVPDAAGVSHQRPAGDSCLLPQRSSLTCRRCYCRDAEPSARLRALRCRS